MDLMDRRTQAQHTLAGRRAAERAMIDAFAARTGVGPLRTAWVGVADVSGVQIDGVNDARDLFVMAWSQPGPLAEAERPHLARDVFSLSLLARTHPGSRAVLLFTDTAALASAVTFVERIARGQRVEFAIVEPFGASTAA